MGDHPVIGLISPDDVRTAKAIRDQWESRKHADESRACDVCGVLWAIWWMEEEGPAAWAPCYVCWECRYFRP